MTPSRAIKRRLWAALRRRHKVELWEEVEKEGREARDGTLLRLRPARPWPSGWSGLANLAWVRADMFGFGASAVGEGKGMDQVLEGARE